MCKSKKNTSQEKSILSFVQDNIATNTMISKATGISRPSICRYKKNLEERGLIFEVERKLCKITGYPAWYLTANKDLISKKNRPC